jgi:small subunit ribosomal protein S27Ae
MAEEKAKKTTKEKKKKTKAMLFEISGDSLKRKNRYCPKCGPGIFMAAHKYRFACGKCGYAEWKK